MTCKPCGRNVGTSQALREHLKNSPAHDFRCDICGKRLSSEEGLAQHVRTARNHVPKVRCTVCGKGFRSEGALQQHAQDSHPRATYKCDACDKTFGSEEALEQHKRSPAHAPTFDCVDCNKGFASEEALQQHMRDSPAHAETFDCEICDKSFGSEEALEQHLQNAKVHRQQAVLQGSYADWEAPEEDQKQMSFFDLHWRVAEEVSDQIDSVWFNEQPDEDCDNFHKTYVMAKFQCGGCSRKSWSSGKVAIVIRQYRPNGYHAIVFNQRCEACNSLGIMTLDENSYVQRVSYRLKVWAGIHVQPPPYREKNTPPHRRELCEGCIAGYCEAASSSVSLPSYIESRVYSLQLMPLYIIHSD